LLKSVSSNQDFGGFCDINNKATLLSV